MGMTKNTRIYSLVITTYYLGDLGHLLQGQMKVATLTSAYNSLNIGHRVYGYKANLYEIMCWGSSDVVIFDIASGDNELASDVNDLVSAGSDLVSGGNDLVSGGNELISGEQFSKWWEQVSKVWERLSKGWA